VEGGQVAREGAGLRSWAGESEGEQQYQYEQSYTKQCVTQVVGHLFAGCGLRSLHIWSAILICLRISCS
jgi:hypothetical protein